MIGIRWENKRNVRGNSGDWSGTLILFLPFEIIDEWQEIPRRKRCPLTLIHSIRSEKDKKKSTVVFQSFNILRYQTDFQLMVSVSSFNNQCCLIIWFYQT